MIDRLQDLWPEIWMFMATCVVMVIGQSRSLEVRRLCAPVAIVGLLIAGLVAFNSRDQLAGPLPHLMTYSKVMIAGIGALLVLLMAGSVDREEEAAVASGKRRFDPLRATRAEFYAFMLFSLTGAMLVASADTLIWLFLALELTSLPTYVMVTISTSKNRSQEAGVKYFFLGALGAATFLYGFSLLYGATGTTHLLAMQEVFARDGVNSIAIAGMLLSIIGVGFKIAAVPMHFYTPDVYQGAATPVAAFLAFTPKTAGFLALLSLSATLGWNYGGGNAPPDAVRVTLWVMAALTMTAGNVLALLQTSVKRMLAYSSIAHSGYMLVGVLAGPGDGGFAQNGLSAVLFYLLCYGVMNLGAFAVIACLENRNDPDREVESIDDLRGLCATHPWLGWTMVLCAGSLLGMPPLLGFFGKVPLFTSAVAAGEIALVVVLALNSAIAAWYYLRLAALPLLEDPGANADDLVPSPFATRRLAGILSALGVIVLAILANGLMEASGKAGTVRDVPGTLVEHTHDDTNQPVAH